MTGVWTDTDFKLMTASGVTDSSLFVLKENGEASNLTIKYPKDEEEKKKGERTATIKSDEIVEELQTLDGRTQKFYPSGSAKSNLEMYGNSGKSILAGKIVDYVLDNQDNSKTKFVLKDGGTVQNLKIKFNVAEGLTGYNSELTSDKLGRDLTSVVNKTENLSTALKGATGNFMLNSSDNKIQISTNALVKFFNLWKK